MFSLQASDELVFGALTPATTTEGFQIPEDLNMADHAAFAETNFINFSSNNSGLTRQSDERESDIKKVVHRDIERNRRKEMSELHITLASLLPAVQPIKGKRPVCDQMQEAANYIKALQNKVEELRNRRDNLTKLSSENREVCDDHCVTVNPLSDDGMWEILIKSGNMGVVSRALEELAERQIDVVNCVSTRSKAGIFLHKMQIQGKDMRNQLDASVQLQHILTNAMASL